MDNASNQNRSAIAEWNNQVEINPDGSSDINDSIVQDVELTDDKLSSMLLASEPLSSYEAKEHKRLASDDTTQLQQDIDQGTRMRLEREKSRSSLTHRDKLVSSPVIAYDNPSFASQRETADIREHLEMISRKLEQCDIVMESLSKSQKTLKHQCSVVNKGLSDLEDSVNAQHTAMSHKLNTLLEFFSSESNRGSINTKINVSDLTPLLQDPLSKPKQSLEDQKMRAEGALQQKKKKVVRPVD